MKNCPLDKIKLLSEARRKLIFVNDGPFSLVWAIFGFSDVRNNLFVFDFKSSFNRKRPKSREPFSEHPSWTTLVETEHFMYFTSYQIFSFALYFSYRNENKIIEKWISRLNTVQKIFAAINCSYFDWIRLIA